MGACSAWIFERGNAGRLIGIGARAKPRIDVGDDKDAVLARVQIGVEHAIIVAELELEADPLLDLESRLPKVRGQVPRRHAGETRRLAMGRNHLDGLLGSGRRRRPRGAGGKEKG